MEQAPQDSAGDTESGGTNPVPQLTEELSNIEREILKAVPQLKEQIHGFVEQLQEALKLPPSEQTESAATEPEQIEI